MTKKAETREPDEALIDRMQELADRCGRAVGICRERPLSTGEATYDGIKLAATRAVVFDFLKKRFPGALEIELARGTGARVVTKNLREGARPSALVDMLSRAEKRGDLDVATPLQERRAP